jgi:ABC-2 type transport system permease protein
MFRAIWSKTLRDYRVPILSWGIGLGLLLFAVFVSVNSISGFASFVQIANQFRFFGDPVAITTPEGYATWRIMGVLVPVLFAIWTVIAGARLVRAEEERGSMDVLLSTSESRTRLLIEKILALAIGIALVGLLIGVEGMLGEAAAKDNVDVGRALLAGLNVSLFGFFFAMLVLFLSQFFANRTAAAGWAGGLLVLSFLLDGTSRVVDNADWLRNISPLSYYSDNKPLIPTFPADFGAVAVLLGVSIGLAILSVLLFQRRDIGGRALPAWLSGRPQVHTDGGMHALNQAQHDVFGRAIVLRALRAQVVSIFWWMVGIVGFAMWMVALTKSLEEPIHKLLAANPEYAKVLGGQDIGTNAGFLAGILFSFLPVLIVIFILVEALSWASDLDSGRMELVLSTPKSRYRVLLERFGAVFIAAVIAPLLSWLGILVAAWLTDTSVDVGNVAAATFGILPLELIVISLVYLLAGRLSVGVVLGIATLYIALAFFVELLRSLLNLPDWVMSLSIFHEYGSPITSGLDWGPFVAMLGVAAVLLVLGVVQFVRSDVGRGA